MKPENDGKIAFQSLAVDSAAVCHLNKHWQMWVTNFGKYPTVEIGNPTQKSIRRCRIPILRNASQQKREIELKRTVINTDCQILRNT